MWEQDTSTTGFSIHFSFRHQANHRWWCVLSQNHYIMLAFIACTLADTVYMVSTYLP